jgi:hypothetical protein
MILFAVIHIGYYQFIILAYRASGQRFQQSCVGRKWEVHAIRFSGLGKV